MAKLGTLVEDSQLAAPAGLIEHAVRTWCVWRTERHYSSVLNTELVRVRDLAEVINE